MCGGAAGAGGGAKRTRGGLSLSPPSSDTSDRPEGGWPSDCDWGCGSSPSPGALHYCTHLKRPSAPRARCQLSPARRGLTARALADWPVIVEARPSMMARCDERQRGAHRKHPREAEAGTTHALAHGEPASRGVLIYGVEEVVQASSPGGRVPVPHHLEAFC